MLIVYFIVKLIFYFGILFGYQVLNRMPSVSFNCATSTPKPTNATTTASATTASTTTATTTTTTSTTTTATTTTAAPKNCSAYLNGDFNAPCALLASYCYCFIKVPMAWSSGKAYCKAFGLSLLWIQSQDEQNVVRTYVSSMPALKGQSYWTSGVFSISTNNFIWDSTGQALNYTNWFLGQPSGRVTCVNLNFVITTGLWFDNDCSFGFYPICKK